MPCITSKIPSNRHLFLPKWHLKTSKSFKAYPANPHPNQICVSPPPLAYIWEHKNQQKRKLQTLKQSSARTQCSMNYINRVSDTFIDNKKDNKNRYSSVGTKCELVCSVRTNVHASNSFVNFTDFLMRHFGVFSTRSCHIKAKTAWTGLLLGAEFSPTWTDSKFLTCMIVCINWNQCTIRLLIFKLILNNHLNKWEKVNPIDMEINRIKGWQLHAFSP